ncbi:ABC transporter ATP-binding protein [Polyangium sorediatum]|uniref:ATP-binding cassette domain-containing protein n=1 Tax=Polyangium sorediatum TaxID=889274 RepID=A0ABT6NNH3_9BACT|nr:ATP-binding cassette domain-containing protein [Polyangium sorediatum]MDI1429882.1 ATP-binding cassette domain-containing protein [Polyangium sorediatum]
MRGPVMKIEDIAVRYGDCWSIRSATITLEPGVIHAILGENGAGKSTLLKAAAGFAPRVAGTVRIEDGAAAIGMVHQHFMLVSAFTALENLVLGSEPTGSFGRLDLAKARREAEALMETTGLRVNLDARTSDLAVGERQRLEILRVLYRGARAILLDEPTAVLSPLEAEELYTTLGALAEGGATIAVVTHRMDEVLRFAGHVTIMRRGRTVLSRPITADERDHPKRLEDELTRAIMGGEPPPEASPPALAEDAEVALSIEDLVLVDAAGKRVLDGLCLAVKKGEIVGIAGIEGNGQRELVRAVAGLEPGVAGSIVLGGARLPAVRSTEDLRKRRRAIAVVHEDRHADGLMLDATVGDNLVLGELGQIDGPAAEAALIKRRIDRFGVNPPDAARRAGELSGGNQQKVVVGRALDRIEASPERALVVLGQPTRGVDVGAAATIHGAIVAAAEKGLAVLVVSADLGELRRLAHRILVLHRGRIVAELPPTSSDDVIGRAMLGMEDA